MTEFIYERKKENVRDYIKTTMFGTNFAHKILIAALAICLLAVAASGIIMCIALNRPSMLILTGVAVILGVAYPLFLHFFIKSLTEKLTKENPDEKGITIGVSEKNILLIRNNTSCGLIEWSDIIDITEGKEGFYLTEKEGSLIILGKNSVHSGTYDEAAQVLTAKKAALK